MTRRDEQRVRDMLDTVEKALACAKNKNRADLDNNEMLTLALVRLLEEVALPHYRKGRTISEILS